MYLDNLVWCAPDWRLFAFYYHLLELPTKHPGILLGVQGIRVGMLLMLGGMEGWDHFSWAYAKGGMALAWHNTYNLLN